MKSIGGLAALSMSGATIAEARETLTDQLPSDPHTADTYRAIVDAIVPRTPELEDELGPEHVPGGLDVELEKFLVWDFNHFQEIRAEMVAERGLLEFDSSDATMAPSTFETALDTTGFGSDLDAVADLADVTLSALDIETSALEEFLTLGPIERFEVSFADLDSVEEGPAEFDLLVETANETTHRVVQNYPYASLFTVVFDLVAAEFLARGKNEDRPSTSEQFAAGGTFARLSRKDRLRCLWTIVDGSVVDDLDELLSPLIPDVGILKYVVMATNGLHGFGYYTEWAGLGETKTENPTDRKMQKPPGEVQSREQSGYPGPAPGHSANWRHAVPGGFGDDWERERRTDDLTGDDVLSGVGGDA